MVISFVGTFSFFPRVVKGECSCFIRRYALDLFDLKDFPYRLAAGDVPSLLQQLYFCPFLHGPLLHICVPYNFIVHLLYSALVIASESSRSMESKIRLRVSTAVLTYNDGDV
jgi:hypothetical protein